MSDSKETCGNCRFCGEARMPGSITTMPICRYDPPKVYILPGPNGAIQVSSFQTQVTHEQWCGKWQSQHHAEQLKQANDAISRMVQAATAGIENIVLLDDETVKKDVN